MSTRELDPADLSAWDLRVHIAEDRAGGWEPTHFTPPGADAPVCEQYAGRYPGETYGLTQDRGIWERWYAAGWGCQTCAEVLHA
jgi:hypothetical protein